MVWIKKESAAKLAAILLFLVALFITLTWPNSDPVDEVSVDEQVNGVIELPDPDIDSDYSVEQAIEQRRSVRSLDAEKGLSLDQVSQLLWAAQGITDDDMMYRAAPSAGATYPLKLYVLVGNNGVEEISEGVYLYNPDSHQLELVKEGDIRSDVYQVALRQSPINNAPISIIMGADFSRTTDRYGDRGDRYVYMEAGHSAQNIYLQAESLGLGTVVIGAFDDGNVHNIVHMDEAHEPLYIIPVGYPN